ncbi:MAG: TIGR02587 family membrane protein, partial [Chloroflexota bacterium]|nr:TIGR02587 family membrane protein [Chloroflexota bacterium]
VFDGDTDRQWNHDEQSTPNWWRATLNDLGATVAGAVFLGISLAPTDEIPMLASGLHYGHLLAVIALSLLLTYLIVFESGFHPPAGTHLNRGPFQHPVTETVFAYVISLLIALLALYLFGRVEWGEPPIFVLAQVLVLGFPAAVGGAAGRLVI